MFLCSTVEYRKSKCCSFELETLMPHSYLIALKRGSILIEFLQEMVCQKRPLFPSGKKINK